MLTSVILQIYSASVTSSIFYFAKRLKKYKNKPSRALKADFLHNLKSQVSNLQVLEQAENW
jgi:hypothetical protein